MLRSAGFVSSSFSNAHAARLSIASRAIEFLQPLMLLCVASVKTRVSSPICIIIWTFPHSCKGLNCYGVGLCKADGTSARKLPCTCVLQKHFWKNVFAPFQSLTLERITSLSSFRYLLHFHQISFFVILYTSKFEQIKLLQMKH